MRYNRLYERALGMAARFHRDQVRKGTDIPYVTHLAHVARLLTLYEADEEVVAAGLLHDILEDTPCTRDVLLSEFGERITEWVVELSEPKEQPWETRKETMLGRIRVALTPVRMVFCADKAHNLHTMADTLEQGGDPWSKLSRSQDVQLTYFKKMELALLDFDHPIRVEWDLAYGRLKQSI